MTQYMKLQLFAEGGEAAAEAPGLPGDLGAVSAHWQSLQEQGAQLAERYGAFDLQAELENPLFFKLTSPGVGVSVEDAYLTVHHRELTEAVAHGVRRELANSMQAGSLRPRENGLDAPAPGLTTFDYRSASRREREAFKQQIYSAAGRGEKVYPAGR